MIADAIEESGTTFKINTAEVAPGDYTLSVRVEREGYEPKIVTQTITVKADLVAPGLTLSSAGEVIQGEQIEFTVDMGEQPTEACTFTALISDASGNPVQIAPVDGTSMIISTADLAPGIYTVVLTVSAGDGYVPQIAMQSFTLNAALEKPMLSLDVDTIEIWNEDLVVTITNVPSTPEVSYTATLVGVEITPVPTWDAEAGTLTIDTSTLGSGTHQLVITASADGYLPVASDPASFDVDVINLNDFIVNVKDHAVVDYEGLDSNITLPEVDDKGAPITAIGENAFVENTGIKTVTISKNIVTIGESAFEGCTALTSVTIPNGVTTIGKAAFKNCSALKTMTPYN